jgi:uncharacterized protein
MSRRDGVDLAHVRRRLRLLARPNVVVTPPPTGIAFDRDVEIPVRDGTILRANVFRPDPDDGPRAVILCTQPYGKDSLPKPRRNGHYGLPFQLRMLPQSEPMRISAWTSWEAPDPAAWVPRGYVVVNCDLRGWGRSDGTGELLSALEAQDLHDVVEWIAAQPWCTGRVGMLGVSYLALTQWAGAAERPPHLAAISPWEGFTDPYRDFMRVGGVLEAGFLRLWSTMMKRMHRSPVDILGDARRHPEYDAFWAGHARDIERIEVPALVGASFSDHNLHSRGTFEGWRRIGSTEKWLHTHRGPKWSTFYAPEVSDRQARFFARFLQDDPGAFAAEAPVRVEVREDAATISAVYETDAWPPADVTWSALAPTADGRLADPPAGGEAKSGRVEFGLRRGRATFTHRFAHDTEVIGPMTARLAVSLTGTDDATVFVGVRKRRAGRVVGFEGSYGFDRALVTWGALRVSHRAVDPARSLPGVPFHPFDRREPVGPGEIVTLEIELAPSATLWRAGEDLELLVQSRWFFPTNPIVGQFPAHYERTKRGRLTVHTGGGQPSALLLPTRPV